MSFPYVGTPNPATRKERARITKIANKQPKRLSLQGKPGKCVVYNQFATLEPVMVEERFTPAVAFEDRV